MSTSTIPFQSGKHPLFVLLMAMLVVMTLLVSPVFADDDDDDDSDDGDPVISFTSVDDTKTEIDINGANLHNGTDKPTVILGLNGEDDTTVDYVLKVDSIQTLDPSHDRVIAKLNEDSEGNTIPTLMDGAYLITVFPASHEDDDDDKYEDGAEFHVVIGAGQQGPQGIQGIAGNDGAPGANGATGLQGPIGLTGATGAIGPIGPIGPAGDDGSGVKIFGIQNTAGGDNALPDTATNTGSLNTAFGFLALQSNTTGSSNTASGANALSSNTTGNLNTATGRSALSANTTGNANTASGVNALFRNTTGSSNTASGDSALFRNTTGSSNTATGRSALSANTTGNANTATGNRALQKNTTGNSNISIGNEALRSNTTGSVNTATGNRALQNNTTGSGNTATGTGALQNNTTGNSNTAIGLSAGANNTTGINSVFIDNIGLPSDGNVIRIGDAQTSAFIKGIFGTNVAGGVAVFVKADGQLGTVLSSGRYKEDIRDLGEVSQRLLNLRPVSFRYKADVQKGDRPVQYGLIAEEVEKVFPELVIYNEEGQPETVAYHILSTLLLNELQGVQSQVIGLKSTRNANEDRLVTLERELKDNRARLVVMEVERQDKDARLTVLEKERQNNKARLVTLERMIQRLASPSHQQASFIPSE